MDYITKPFQHEEVLARIRTHIALQRLKQCIGESEERLASVIQSALDAIFNTDGTPSCFIRGHGQQAFGNVTNEASERYPTCTTRFFANNEELVDTRDAASLLAGSPKAGVVEETIYSAIGRVLNHSTYKPNPSLVPLERATFRYDALGNLTSMTRYQDPLCTATVTTSWHYDSLGQVLQLDEPDSAPQFRSYDNWGELTQVQWLDTTTNPATDRRTITQYDALGRVIHSEDRTNNVAVAATVNDYLYDQPVNVTTPPVLATNVLGRLAKATFPIGAVSFSYDGLGRVNTQIFTDTTTAPVGVSYATSTAIGKKARLERERLDWEQFKRETGEPSRLDCFTSLSMFAECTGSGARASAKVGYGLASLPLKMILGMADDSGGRSQTGYVHPVDMPDVPIFNLETGEGYENFITAPGGFGAGPSGFGGGGTPSTSRRTTQRPRESIRPGGKAARASTAEDRLISRGPARRLRCTAITSFPTG